MQRHFVGLDVHKVRTQFCVTDETGEVVEEGSIPSELAWTLIREPEKTSVVLEATGNWCAVYDGLVATGAEVKLAHPSRVKAIASARIKTDKIDATILSHLLRANLIPEAWAPPQEVRDLRELIRMRWSFVTARTMAKNRIHILIAKEGYRFSGTDLFGLAGRNWVCGLPLREHTGALLGELMDAIQEADRHVTSLTASLKRRLEGSEALRTLMAIPGVGFVTAATLIAEIGDPKRFTRKKQIASYFGLVPRVRASAEHARYGHITRSGSSHARRALVEAALIAIRYPGPVRNHFRSVASRRGKKVAVVAAARILLIVSWTMLVREEVHAFSQTA